MKKSNYRPATASDIVPGAVLHARYAVHPKEYTPESKNLPGVHHEPRVVVGQPDGDRFRWGPHKGLVSPLLPTLEPEALAANMYVMKG